MSSLSDSTLPQPPSSSWIPWVALLIVSLPWLAMITTQPTHLDIIWLSTVMERILSGQTMSEHAYETNPPLSMFVYLIPAALHKYLGIDIRYSALAQSFTLLGISFYMLRQAVRQLSFLNAAQCTAILIGFVAASTISAKMQFGEKDHYIGMIMPAFLLMQLSITQNPALRQKFTWPFFILSSLLILVKPHHGLLPTLMLGHRIYKRRDWSFLKDPDFLALSLCTIGYLSVIKIFFPDYLSTVMPDVLKYYSSSISPERILPHLIAVAGVSALMIMVIRRRLNGGSAINLAKLFLSAGLISVIPYLVQGKGFYYHLLPAVIFLEMACALILYEWFSKELWGKKWALILLIPTLTFYPYVSGAIHYNYPDMKVFADILYEEEKVSGNRTFVIFDDRIDLGQHIQEETGYEYGSRFASLFFGTRLYIDSQLKAAHTLTPEQEILAEQEFQRFAGMMKQDLDYYKPGIIFVLAPEFFAEEYGIEFDLVKFFSQSQAFKDSFDHYKLAGQVSYDCPRFFHNTKYKVSAKKFLIYRRSR